MVLWPLLYVVVRGYLSSDNFGSDPLKRPMFHDSYGPHPSRGGWPHWWLSYPVRDKAGNELWADFEDNVLVILVTCIPPGTSVIPYSLSAGLTESRFKLPNGHEVLLQKCRNELVVISRTGDTRFARLGTGEAGRFFKNAQMQDHVDDILTGAISLVSAQEATRLRALKTPAGSGDTIP
jgi:hypothetical protein